MRSNPEWKRGDVVRVRLNLAEGSEQAGERPALIVSPDIINRNSPVILIAAITSRKTERLYPFEALVEPPEGGLTQRSKVLLLHLRSIDKGRITGVYGAVSEATMQRVDSAIQIATGLAKV